MNFVSFHAPAPAESPQAARLAGLRVYLDSLGCAKNLVDSEATLGLLAASGAERAMRPEDADVLVVNTCGFLESAREESIDRILELATWKADGRARMLAVLGCLVSRAADELAESIPEVDVWLPAGRHGDLPGRLAARWDALPEDSVRRAADRSGSRRAPITAFAGFGRRALLTPAHTAYLKISEGCTNTCSFCSIPLMRGTQRSRALADIVDEAAMLAARGVRELHLVAQDLTHWGFDRPERQDLLDLVRALGEVRGIEWLRLLYAHPAHLTPRMLAGLYEVPQLARYLDMPIQHAVPKLLRAMRRPYGPERVRRQCAELRARVPEITLRTTVIVGFPGETERDFETLCRFLDEVAFDRVGIFTYSREPGTTSFDLPGRPRRSTAERRMQALVEQQMHAAAARAQRRIGTRLRVLVDGEVPPEDRDTPIARGAVAVGRSEHEALDIDGGIYLEGPVPPPGTFIWAEVTDADVYDLRATALDAATTIQGSRSTTVACGTNAEAASA